MNNLRVEAAGVVVKDAGYKRSPMDIARDFVREQSCGEWGDKLVEEDAAKLAQLLVAYARAGDGPVIPPWQFGGEECLCRAGTESWCKAVGCPRRRALSPLPVNGGAEP